MNWLSRLGQKTTSSYFRERTRASATVRAAFVFGEAAPELEAALSPRMSVVRVDTLDQALHEAARRAETGIVIALPPEGAESAPVIEAIMAQARQ